jgi:hypothetical protein
MPQTLEKPNAVGAPQHRERRSSHAALALMLAFASTALAAPAARAWSPWPQTEPTVHGRLVDVQVEVEGCDVPLYPSSNWDGRRYFEATRGREYSVVLRNVTGQRVAVLVAVDGLNVISGQRSSLGNGEAMYVLDPYGATTIRGWRTSLDDVRRFVFVDEERSYATRSGQANGDLGWIRVLAFRERQPVACVPQFRAQDDARGEPAPAPAAEPENAQRQSAGSESRADAPSVAEKKTAGRDALGKLADKDEANANPGTGWGRGAYDPVREVEFVAESRPLDRVTLRYEYADGLRALGITPVRDHDRTWQRDHGQLGFAAAPRW